MARTSSYYLYERYEKRGDQDWIPSYPNTYSKDGDGTMPLVVRVARDEACGWHCDPEYQWVDVPISEDYVCDECDIDIDFRWVSTSAYTYIGDYKYEILQEQFRKDNGEWIDTQNTKLGNPVRVAKKIKLTMKNGDVFSQSCGTDDGIWYSFNGTSSAVFYSEKSIQHLTNTFKDGVPAFGSGIDENYNGLVDKIEFGDCVTELGWRYRNSSNGCGKSYWDNDVATSGQRIRNYSMLSFASCGAREIVFPQGLRWIGGGFGGNKITALTIPSSVESIGKLRSFDQSSPTSSCISKTGSGTFAGNRYLRNLTLNEGLKSIGEYDFGHCTSLERVYLPASLERIGYSIFGDCSNLKQIIFQSETPPTLICDDDSQYYGSQCRGEESVPNIATNDDAYIYVPCGSRSAYTAFFSDFPAERIVEYSGACGSIPSIDSMYNVIFSYKVGSATTNVYRSGHTISGSNDSRYFSDEIFADVIDEYADEIFIPLETDIVGYTETTSCGKITIGGRISGWTSQPTTFVTNAKEIVISSTCRTNVSINGGANTEKVVVDANIQLFGFIALKNLKEVYINGCPTLRGRAFSSCPKLSDIYITYSGSVIPVQYNTSPPIIGNLVPKPTIHVPCELYGSYISNNFWGQFNIVKNSDECEQPQLI